MKGKNKLRSRQQRAYEAYQLYKVSGLTQPQISKKLGISLGTTNAYIHSFDKVDAPVDYIELFLKKVRNKSFEEFWDILGRPVKHGKPLGVLSYERDLVEVLEREKHLLIVKPVGSGITEFCLRWILWKVTSSNDLRRSQVVIVVGPAQSLANRIITRIRDQLADDQHRIFFDTAKNYFSINDVEIFSVPSHNLDAMRSLEKPSILYCSEADFMPNESSVIRAVFERYIAKSSPWVIYESTIGSVDGLLSQIYHEPADESIYFKCKINYEDCLREGMYNLAEIERAKRSRSFNRELLCEFGSAATGNTFPPLLVDQAFNLFHHHQLPEPYLYAMAVDPGWSPAKSGVTVIGTDRRGMKTVMLSDEFNESEDAIVDLVVGLRDLYGGGVKNIFVDASDKRFIRRLKSNIYGERVDYEDYIKYLKETKILNQYNPLKNLMVVVPLPFTQESSAEMLSYTRVCLEQQSIAIPPNCKALKNALYAAQDVDGNLLKGPLSRGNGGDCLDSFRMCLWGLDN